MGKVAQLPKVPIGPFSVLEMALCRCFLQGRHEKITEFGIFTENGRYRDRPYDRQMAMRFGGRRIGTGAKSCVDCANITGG